jgi:hypothetical protein
MNFLCRTALVRNDHGQFGYLRRFPAMAEACLAVIATLSKGYDLDYVWRQVDCDLAKDAAGYYLQASESGGEPPGRWWGRARRPLLALAAHGRRFQIGSELVRPAVVRPAGFEPATRCLEGTCDSSQYVAWCRLTGLPAAAMIAGSRLASLRVCRCWLPLWLPQFGMPCRVQGDRNC